MKLSIKVAALAALAASAFGAAQAQETKTVVEVGHLLAVPGNGYLRNRSVTIEGGKIVSVERGFEDHGDDVRVIDLRDAYVVPGLIDSHVHLSNEFSPTSRMRALSDSEVDAALNGAAPREKDAARGLYNGPGCRRTQRSDLLTAGCDPHRKSTGPSYSSVRPCNYADWRTR